MFFVLFLLFVFVGEVIVLGEFWGVGERRVCMVIMECVEVFFLMEMYFC